MRDDNVNIRSEMPLDQLLSIMGLEVDELLEFAAIDRVTNNLNRYCGSGLTKVNPAPQVLSVEMSLDQALINLELAMDDLLNLVVSNSQKGDTYRVNQDEECGNGGYPYET